MPVKPILTLTLCCALCLGAQAQNSSKYLKSMAQEDYTLYFINPVEFKAEKSKSLLIPDFTFQYDGNTPEKVDLRFSVFSEAPLKETGKLSFRAGEETLGSSSGLELMFLEQVKGRWHSRFTTSLPYSTLMKMLQAGENLVIGLSGQEAAMAFPADKQWEKASAVVKEIFVAEIGKE